MHERMIKMKFPELKGYKVVIYIAMVICGALSVMGGFGLIYGGRIAAGAICSSVVFIGYIALAILIAKDRHLWSFIVSTVCACTSFICCNVCLWAFLDDQKGQLALWRNHASSFIVAILCLALWIWGASLREYKERLEFSKINTKKEKQELEK